MNQTSFMLFHQVQKKKKKFTSVLLARTRMPLMRQQLFWLCLLPSIQNMEFALDWYTKKYTLFYIKSLF